MAGIRILQNVTSVVDSLYQMRNLRTAVSRPAQVVPSISHRRRREYIVVLSPITATDTSLQPEDHGLFVARHAEIGGFRQVWKYVTVRFYHGRKNLEEPTRGLDGEGCGSADTEV